MRICKISWFVGGKQINYLPKLKAEAKSWSVRHWQIKIFSIAITKFNNNIVLSFDHWVCFLNSERSAKRSAIFTQEQIICGQTQLDNIAYEQTIICLQLFISHVVGAQCSEHVKSWVSWPVYDCVKEERFSSYQWAKVGCQRPPGSDRPLPCTLMVAGENPWLSALGHSPV